MVKTHHEISFVIKHIHVLHTNFLLTQGSPLILAYTGKISLLWKLMSPLRIYSIWYTQNPMGDVTAGMAGHSICVQKILSQTSCMGWCNFMLKCICMFWNVISIPSSIIISIEKKKTVSYTSCPRGQRSLTWDQTCQQSRACNSKVNISQTYWIFYTCPIYLQVW